MAGETVGYNPTRAVVDSDDWWGDPLPLQALLPRDGSPSPRQIGDADIDTLEQYRRRFP